MAGGTPDRVALSQWRCLRIIVLGDVGQVLIPDEYLQRECRSTSITGADRADGRHIAAGNFTGDDQWALREPPQQRRLDVRDRG